MEEPGCLGVVGGALVGGCWLGFLDSCLVGLVVLLGTVVETDPAAAVQHSVLHTARRSLAYFLSYSAGSLGIDWVVAAPSLAQPPSAADPFLPRCFDTVPAGVDFAQHSDRGLPVYTGLVVSTD